MAISSFYFDEMMPRAAAQQLAARGYIVTMAVDVGMTEQKDFSHLAFATEHHLVMVTFDRPFAGKASATFDHAGVICLSGSQDQIGNIVRMLIEFSNGHTSDAVAGKVFWL